MSRTDKNSRVEALRQYHQTLDKQDLSWRKEQLRALKKMLKENKDAFLEALHKDLGTSPTEGSLLQLGVVSSEIKHTLKNLDSWAKSQKVSTPIHLQPASSHIVHDPLGVALIIGAWNYPLLLTLSPLVACIAGGNAAVIKPSEMSPATAALLTEMLPRYLDPKAFQVVNGGVPETTALLKERFDKIFFTGSANVGKIVMEAAAKHLTPVTLELGGQSPCIIDRSANLKLAALRIVFAKFSNAGQTCVAPNHIFVHKDVADEFTAILKKTIEKFYGKDPHASADYGRIVNGQHHRRLVALMEGQNIAHGGDHDIKDLYIAPTVLTNVDLASPIMQQEIFGPLLPIVTVNDLSEAFNHISANEHPLAAYVFARDKEVIQQAEKINAGSIGINNAMVQLGVPDLPFGGVGQSGFGQYHGKAGFEAFTHAKAVFHSGPIETGLHYPPHDRKLNKAILKKLGILG